MKSNNDIMPPDPEGYPTPKQPNQGQASRVSNRVALFVAMASSACVAMYLATPTAPEKLAPTKSDANREPRLWTLHLGDGSKGVLIPLGSDPGGARVEGIRPSNQDKYDVQLTLPLNSVVAGQEIGVSFDIRADQPREAIVTAIANAPPWENLGLDQLVAATREWARVDLSFQSKANAAESSIRFNLGASDIAVEVRNAIITKGASQRSR